MRSLYLLISFLLVYNTIFPTNEREKSPNFIFILADDQGWNGTSVKMNDTIPYSASDFYETPNLEILAKREWYFQMLMLVPQFVRLADIVFNLVKHQQGFK